METPTIPPASTPSATAICRTARVYVAGQRRRDLAVTSWEWLPAPRFGMVKLQVHPADGVQAAPQANNLCCLPAIGAEVIVRPPEGSSGREFRGVVFAHRSEISDRGEFLLADVEHALASKLTTRIDSLRRVVGDSFADLPETRVVFNDGGNSRASSELQTVGSRQARLFADGEDAIRWTVSDALAYLLACWLPDGVSAPELSELENLAPNLDLGRLDVTGKTLADALVDVAARGGLELRAASDGLGLVFYRPGRDGRSASVCLQSSGQQLDTRSSNLWRSKLTFLRRPGRPGVAALGARKQYEATFTMSPGWDSAQETSRWRDFARSMSSDWPAKAEVYRKWALNEHGGCCGSPWNLDAYDFSTINADDFPHKVARRFLPCLSRDACGVSLGIVVEYRCDAEGSWRRWPTQAFASDTECAVYLGGDALPADYFQAAVAGDVELRVTATVEADARLTAEVAGDADLSRHVVVLTSRAGWRQVHASSVFYGDSSLGESDECDDSAVLAALAERHAQMLAGAVGAELTLGWIDTTWGVGDLVQSIDGRGLDLSGGVDFATHVHSVRHDFAESLTTTLTLRG